VFGVVLLVFGVISYRVLARQLDTDATANLAELTSGLHGYLRFSDGAPSVAFDPNDVDQSAFIDAATRYYQIYDATTGRLLAQSQALEPYGVRFTPSEVKAFREHPAAIDLRTDYGRIRLSNSVMPGPDGHLYLLQVGGSLDAMDAALARFLTLLLWSLPAGLVAAALAGWAMASLSLAPLARLATAARQIDVRNLQQRLPVRGAGDELDAVAASFNDTLSRLEKAVEEMRQFSTALAHELRTPLTALRGEIEMSLLGAQPDDEASRKLASQLEEIDKLKRLIEQILTLARAEAGDIPLARVSPRSERPVCVARRATRARRQSKRRARRLRARPACRRRGRCAMAGTPCPQPPRQRHQIHSARRYRPSTYRAARHRCAARGC
jgi:signal transduction histidine kinase